MRCRAWGSFGCASGLARCCVRPLDGEDLAAQTGITADPTTTPVAISLAPTTPACPTGLERSPSVRPPEHGSLCRGPGVIALRGGPGHRLPLVALMPQ
jgi:hypothetical protein